MEINRRDFITKVSAIAALSVLPSSFVAAMGNEKVEKAKPKYPTLKCDVVEYLPPLRQPVRELK